MGVVSGSMAKIHVYRFTCLHVPAYAPYAYMSLPTCHMPICPCLRAICLYVPFYAPYIYMSLVYASHAYMRIC